MRGRTTTGLAALGTTVVLLAGCTGGSDPGATPSATNGTATPSSSTTTAATSSGTATTPSGAATVTIPAAARARTPEGAEAFASFYLRTYSVAATRADSSSLKALSDPSCKGCAGLIKLIDEYQAKGQRADRASLTVDLTSIRPLGTDASPVVDVLGEDAPKRIVDSAGTVIANVSGAKFTFRLNLNWSGNGWVVSSLQVVR